MLEVGKEVKKKRGEGSLENLSPGSEENTECPKTFLAHGATL